MDDSSSKELKDQDRMGKTPMSSSSWPMPGPEFQIAFKSLSLLDGTWESPSSCSWTWLGTEPLNEVLEGLESFYGSQVLSGSSSSSYFGVGPDIGSPEALKYIQDFMNETELPEPKGLRDLIGSGGCSEPYLKVFDVTEESQKRLILDSEFVSKHYLGMLNVGESVGDGIRVTVYGPDAKGYEMTFRFDWNGDGVYDLTEGWFDFAKAHGLEGRWDWLRIWMFRRKNTNGLCFAITWNYLPWDGIL